MTAGSASFRQSLAEDECFVCGTTLNKTNKSEEDVFSKWVRKRLHGRRHLSEITSGFGQRTVSIAYIKVPACVSCNRHKLGAVESRLAGAFDVGSRAVALLPESDKRIWAAKVSYATRLKDMSLSSNRRVGNAPPLALAADLRAMNDLHYLLQEVRGTVRVAPGRSTFFSFDTQSVDCDVCDLDFAVPLGWPYIVMLRLKNVALIGAADDRSALAHLRKHPAFVAAQELCLHPVQVRALLAIILSECSRIRVNMYPSRTSLKDGIPYLDHGATSDVHPVMQSASVDPDLILARMLGESVESLAQHQGAVGLLVDGAQQPRHIQWEHGRLRLDTLSC